MSSKRLFVDKNGSGPYSPNGSYQSPFLSITDAVNQIITNSDNSLSIPYFIDISPGIYNENLDLSDSALVNIAFDGHDSVTLSPISGNSLQSTSNNNGLLSLVFKGLTFDADVLFQNSVNNG